jgi:4-amino-4-deoxy-L-arabinose transferase-like glycosyltransferase
MRAFRGLRLASVDIVAARPARPTAEASSDHATTAEPRRLPNRWYPYLAGLALFALALAPRLIGIEQHLTADDQDWVRRVSRFSVAVQQGDLGATYQSSHPGLPVLWLGSLAFGGERSVDLAALAGSLPRLEKTPFYLEALFDARRALTLVSAGLTVILAFLAWRLFGPGPGVLAGMLLASEPFLVAHGKLLHTDALLAQLMAVSVLAALAFFDGRGGIAYLIGSGLAAGLAFSTKAPAVFLFGFVPLFALVACWRRTESPTAREGNLVSFGRQLALQLVVWGLAAAVVYLLLWPALWVEPLGTLNRMVASIRGVGESPRRWGNFFLGQAVQEDVGPLFYPVVTLLRVSPLTLAGLLLVGWFGLRRSRSASAAVDSRARPLTGPSQTGSSTFWRSEALFHYVALYALMMTLSPKKLDRYLLPAFPILDVLAAVGLWLAIGAMVRYVSPPALAGGRRATALTASVLAVGLSQAALVASVQPYPLSFFNPLLGGIHLARQTVIVGWGEGTDQVAAYLDRQPNAADIVVTSLYHDLIHAQSKATGVPLWEWQRAGYLAHYVNMDQRYLLPGPLQSVVESQAPEFIARINGLDYAWLYAIPPEVRAQGEPQGAPRGTRVPRP